MCFLKVHIPCDCSIGAWEEGSCPRRDSHASSEILELILEACLEAMFAGILPISALIGDSNGKI